MSQLKKKRLDSLDVFRGATIAGMMLVNNPGTWGAIYDPLQHASWHGWTPTDLVFPFFMFIVGTSVVLALGGRVDDKPALSKKIAFRALKIFGVGLLLAAFPFFTFYPEFGLDAGLAQLRIPGVLQRIALCYFAASMLFIYANEKTERYVFWGILIVYWAVIALVPVPGVGPADLSLPEMNFGAWLDRTLLGEHLWAGTGKKWDPEGLLSTVPAICTVLLGMRAGRILKSDDSEEKKMSLLFVHGAVLITAGFVWDWFFPINKGLWTSSYVLFAGGLAFSAFALSYYLIDYKGYKKYFMPFKMYGMNAIAVYAGAGMLARLMGGIRWETGEGNIQSLKGFIYSGLFENVISEKFGSMLFGICFSALWFFVAWALYKKKIFIKL